MLRDYLEKLGLATADLKSRALAEKLDEVDPLRELRNEFHYPKSRTLPQTDLSLLENPDEECVYLCGNSLGLMPKYTAELMNEQFQKWSEMGVFGHFTEPLAWTKSDERGLDQIAQIVGAERCEVVLMNTLTVNIHVLFAAFYKPTPKRHKILIESRAFPSDHYAIESQIRLKGLDPATSMVCFAAREGEEVLRIEDILKLLDEEGDSFAVIFFSGVQYYTGQLFDVERITKAAQSKGCLVGWDMAHAFANVPLKLHDWNVDFACWCTYKYGCSGAGGIGGAFIHSRHVHDETRDRMLGWWGHCLSSRFQMSNKMELAEGALSYRVSNTPFMLSVGMLGYLKVYEKTSIEELRKKSYILTGYLEELLNLHLKAHQNIHCRIITPSDPHQRGCQLSLHFDCDITQVFEALIRRGIAVDKRLPNVIRVTPVHIYNSFYDCWRFVNRLCDALKNL